MKFRATSGTTPGAKRRSGGFTLAEVLAALLFMAIVIPVAVQGLHVASLAGQVGQRKSVAARVGDRMLNEMVVTGQWKNAGQSGSVDQGGQEYAWQLQAEPWGTNTLQLVSVTVTYQVQGNSYNLRLCTLVDSSTQTQTQAQ